MSFINVHGFPMVFKNCHWFLLFFIDVHRCSLTSHHFIACWLTSFNLHWFCLFCWFEMLVQPSQSSPARLRLAAHMGFLRKISLLIGVDMFWICFVSKAIIATCVSKDVRDFVFFQLCAWISYDLHGLKWIGKGFLFIYLAYIHFHGFPTICVDFFRWS